MKYLKTVFAILAICAFVWWLFTGAESEPCGGGGFYDADAGVCIYPQDASSASQSPAPLQGK